MLWWLLQNTLTATVLAGIVALLCRLGRPSPAVRHALWVLVLVKLVTPPLVEWPWALPDGGLLSAAVDETAGTQASPRAAHGSDDGGLDFAFTVAIGPEGDPSLAAPSESSPASRAEGPLAWAAWLAPFLLPGWLAGTGVMVCVQFIRMERFRRLVARGVPAPHWLVRQVRDLAARLSVWRPATRVVPGLSSPYIWSLARPTLLWPPDLTQTLSDDSRQSVLVHELAHLRRRDHWVGWLLAVAECLWWWNPLFWYARRQVRFWAELACDAWVVRTLPEQRRAYAEALIEVTELVSRTAAPVPALGMSGAARHAFERRLTMIMTERVPCKVPAWGLAAIGFLALAALPGWSQVPAPAKPAPEKTVVLATGDRLVEVEGLLSLLGTDEKEVATKDVLLHDVFAFVADDKDGAPEKRIQALEKKIQALLDEVKTLKGGAKDGPGKPQTYTIVKPQTGGNVLRYRLVAPGKDGQQLTIVSPEGKTETRTFQYRLANPKVEGGKTFIVSPDGKGEPKTFEFRLDGAGKEGVGTIVLGEDKKGDGKPQVLYRKVIEGQTKNESAGATSQKTYVLPEGKARVLARFLKENVKASTLDIKVDGDSVTVTTTPEAQKTISQIVSLMQGKTRAETSPKPRVALQVKPVEVNVERKAVVKPAEKDGEKKTYRLYINDGKGDGKPIIKEFKLDGLEGKAIVVPDGKSGQVHVEVRTVDGKKVYTETKDGPAPVIRQGQMRLHVVTPEVKKSATVEQTKDLEIQIERLKKAQDLLEKERQKKSKDD